MKLLPKAIKDYIKRFIYKNSMSASQCGQDYWVCGEVFNGKRGGYFLDIGAHNGLDLSNSYILESRYNWSGLCIEANPASYTELKKQRRVKCLNMCIDAEEGEVDFALNGLFGGIVGQDLDNTSLDDDRDEVVRLQTVPLISVLIENDAPHVIDYLSIDVEGAEDRVLGGFDFDQYTFRCITIERPSEKLRNLFLKHGYLLIKEIPDLDSFYIHQSFLAEYHQNRSSFYAKKYLSIRWR